MSDDKRDPEDPPPDDLPIAFDRAHAPRIGAPPAPVPSAQLPALFARLSEAKANAARACADVAKGLEASSVAAVHASTDADATAALERVEAELAASRWSRSGRASDLRT